MSECGKRQSHQSSSGPRPILHFHTWVRPVHCRGRHSLLVLAAYSCRSPAYCRSCFSWGAWTSFYVVISTAFLKVARSIKGSSSGENHRGCCRSFRSTLQMKYRLLYKLCESKCRISIITRVPRGGAAAEWIVKVKRMLFPQTDEISRSTTDLIHPLMLPNESMHRELQSEAWILVQFPSHHLPITRLVQRQEITT